MAGGDWPLKRLRSVEQLGAFFMSLSSLGLDRQINAIHHGPMLNWRYLLTQLEASFELPPAATFDRLSGKAWRGEVQSAVILVEYKDGLQSSRLGPRAGGPGTTSAASCPRST